jgi:hypothetical protein
MTPALIVGRVEAPDAESAIEEAIKQFGIKERIPRSLGSKTRELNRAVSRINRSGGGQGKDSNLRYGNRPVYRALLPGAFDHSATCPYAGKVIARIAYEDTKGTTSAIPDSRTGQA